MPAVDLHSTALAEGERNRRIYAGDIIVFRGFPAVGDLIARPDSCSGA